MLPTVHAPGRQEFLRADDAQRIADLRADEVLPALTARQRKVRRAHAASLGEIGDELGVFVVGMRRDVEHAAALAEGAHFLQDGRGRWRRGGLGTDRTHK